MRFLLMKLLKNTGNRGTANQQKKKKKKGGIFLTSRYSSQNKNPHDIASSILVLKEKEFLIPLTDSAPINS